MSNNPSQPSEETKAQHRLKTKQEYYRILADAPEDFARVLHVYENGDEEATVYQGEGEVLMRVDKEHELWLSMKPKLAAKVGAELLVMSGIVETVRILKEKAHVPESAEAVEGSGNPQPGD